MKRLISIVAMVMVMFWCGSAMAETSLVESHQLQADDYGGYDEMGNWFWHANFLPASGGMTLFFDCPQPDGTWRKTTNNTPGDNCIPLDIQIDFATDWAAHAVAPHRDGVDGPVSQQAFFKWTWLNPNNPSEGKSIPGCDLSLVRDDATQVEWWVFACTETRPGGYEGTNLYCNSGYDDRWPCNGLNTDELGNVDCNPPSDNPLQFPDMTGDQICNASGISHIIVDQDTGPDPITYLPNADCSGIGDNNCIGRYSLSDMGFFDEGIFQWNQGFKDLMNSQHYSTPDSYPELWEPIQDSGLITEGDWTVNDYRLDRRVYPNDRFTMLDLHIQTGDYTKYPTVYLAGDNGNQWINVWFGPINWSDVGICEWEGDPHANCPDTNGDGIGDVYPESPIACCRPFGDAMQNPWIDTENVQELTDDRILEIKWIETGETTSELWSRDGGTLYSIGYDMGKRMWNDADITSPLIYGMSVRYKFQTLAPLEDQHFEITYDEVLKGTLTFTVTDVREMPVVPGTITQIQYVESKDEAKANKSGKAIKMLAEEVEINNITVREVINPVKPEQGAALVIQWPEPDGSLFGGMQMRVYIAGAIGNNDIQIPDDNHFLWIDSPAQTGTVVVPATTWQPFKILLQDKGESQGVFGIQYRVTADHFQNRGHSDQVYFPLN